MFSLVNAISGAMSPDDRDKLDYLYRKYERYMYVVAFDIMKHKEDSEDAVHDAFLKIIDHLDKITDCDSQRTKAFLAVVTRSVCISELRSRNPNVVSIEEIDEELLASESLEDMLFRENPEFADPSFTNLEDIYRDVLTLRYYNDMTIEDIARILDVGVSAVKMRIKRGKEAYAEEIIKTEGEKLR